MRLQVHLIRPLIYAAQPTPLGTAALHVGSHPIVLNSGGQGLGGPGSLHVGFPATEDLKCTLQQKSIGCHAGGHDANTKIHQSMKRTDQHGQFSKLGSRFQCPTECVTLAIRTFV